MENKIRISRIIDKTTGSLLVDIGYDECEYMSPKEYIITLAHASAVIQLSMHLITVDSSLILAKDASTPIDNNARSIVLDHLQDVANVPTPTRFVEILSSPLKKKEQIKLLKAEHITKQQLEKLMLIAEDMGYTYSQYKTEVLPDNTSEEELPNAFGLNADGSVKKMGESSLTDGQLKSIIDSRNVEVAKFFDKDEVWHCFYFTYRGMEGKEHGAHGSQPHIHYWSSAFGLDRKELINKLKAGNMPSSSLHIGIYD